MIYVVFAHQVDSTVETKPGLVPRELPAVPKIRMTKPTKMCVPDVFKKPSADDLKIVNGMPVALMKMSSDFTGSKVRVELGVRHRSV